jgi:hypothetical protein
MTNPLAKLRERHEAATEGDWKAECYIENPEANLLPIAQGHKKKFHAKGPTGVQGAAVHDALALATYHNTYGALLDFVEAVVEMHEDKLFAEVKRDYAVSCAVIDLISALSEAVPNEETK